MKRSLLCLFLVPGALAACDDKPPGQLEPIPRPADYKEPPKPEAPKPLRRVDPNKVALRWKLAEGTPVALKLEGTPGAATVYVLQRPKAGDTDRSRVASRGRQGSERPGHLQRARLHAGRAGQRGPQPGHAG